MRSITLLQPRRVAFGSGCAQECVADILATGARRVLVVTSPPVCPLAEPIVDALRRAQASVAVYDGVAAEPTVDLFSAALAQAREVAPQAIVGIGGGSALDVAKLLAALHNSSQEIPETLGVNQLASRNTFLACLPTTAGTGSEVSPNAILLDEAEQLKKAAVSPHLMPDAAYVDPSLTLTVPRGVTAAAGLDALTHCIEGYANVFAHPMIDLYALEGIRLIGAGLQRAVEDGGDLEARERVALGSLYGGLCLGPVGTGAVHALAYPLGGRFHVAHGLSNALLLPYVLEFNLPAAAERYAQVALALGVEPGATPLATARRGIERMRELSRQCGIAQTLSELGIPAEALAEMAQAAMKVTRLLKNNVRPLSEADARAIYQAAF